jgi:UDP:flavonoid glycosyltransferase YjiC (YdhE family)
MNPVQKPNVLVFPFGLMAHYLRCIVLGRALKDQYNILFMDHPSYRGFLQKEGFHTFTCQTWEGQSVIEKLRHFDFSWLGEEQVQAIFKSQFKAIKELCPYMVLGDSHPCVKMSAEAAGVKFVSLQNGYMTPYYSGHRTLSRRHPCYWPLWFMPPTWKQHLTERGEARAFQKIQKVFNKIRDRYGLMQLDSYVQEWEGDFNLICDTEELFPQANLPSHYIPIGPLIYDRLPWDGAVPPFSPFPACLNKTKRTILVNMGSSGDWNKVRFLTDPYYRKFNIVTAGDAGGVLAKVATHRAEFLMASEVLPWIDLVICHGGNGILQQCQLFNVPALGKTRYFEQEWNMNAFQQKGRGFSLDGIRSKRKLRHIIDHWAGMILPPIPSPQQVSLTDKF